MNYTLRKLSFTFVIAVLLCPAAFSQTREEILERLMDVKPLFQRPDTVSMYFMGDVMMHARQLNYDFHPFLREMRSRISSADIAFANMEFTLAGEPYTGYPCFSAPDQYAQYVADCGVDVFLTANNHILDKGRKGLERTVSRYKEMTSRGIQFTGVSLDEAEDTSQYPLMITCKDVRIAILNFTYGTNNSIDGNYPKVNRLDRKDIGMAIGRARRRGADFIIALPHWGKEYELIHSQAQEQMARWMAEEGVDLIVGSHPHVVQDTSVILTSSGKKVPVIYSMGNAVSNMSAPNTRLELFVTEKIAIDWMGRKKMLSPQLGFMWCTLPGKVFESYSTIPLDDYMDRRSRWKLPSDYDNMISTYTRVKTVTGIGK